MTTSNMATAARRRLADIVVRVCGGKPGRVNPTNTRCGMVGPPTVTLGSAISPPWRLWRFQLPPLRCVVLLDIEIRRRPRILRRHRRRRCARAEALYHDLLLPLEAISAALAGRQSVLAGSFGMQAAVPK